MTQENIYWEKRKKKELKIKENKEKKDLMGLKKISWGLSAFIKHASYSS